MAATPTGLYHGPPGTGVVPRMLQIHPVPAFSDNYIWLLDDAQGNALAVDPGDARPVIDWLASRSLRLSCILVTHHHPDHTGGVADLLEHFGPLPVFGPAQSPYAGVSHAVAAGEHLELLGKTARVLAVPGHTLDHIAFFFAGTSEQAPILFCGDTLFAGGCGRVFEGNPAMMHASLLQLAALPPDTRVCCAHEYTLSNLRFAQAVEPGNAALQQRHVRDTAARSRNEPTLPSTLALELATNPFLRCREPTVREAARSRAGRELADAADVFAEIRSWKDVFR